MKKRQAKYNQIKIKSPDLHLQIPNNDFLQYPTYFLPYTAPRQIRYNIWLSVYKLPIMQQQNSNKTQILRKQIRERHLNSLFSQKRKIIDDKSFASNDYATVGALDRLLTDLKTMNNTPGVVVQIGNCLFNEDLLEMYQREKGEANFNEFCYNLVYVIFNTIIPSQNRFLPEALRVRNNSLIVVSNILADKQTSKQLLIPIIGEALQNIYGSMSQYGESQQIIEIGWILGNIFCHRFDVCHEDVELALEILLSWVEQILTVSDMQLINFLYKSLDIFFHNLDYRIGCSQSGIVEHYKTYRQILVQEAIEQNCSIKMGSSLFYVLKFIGNNFKYVQLCEPVVQKILLKKCQQMMHKQCHQKNLQETLNVVNILCQKQENAIIIYRQNFQLILQIFVSNSIPIKLKCLEIMTKIIIDRVQVEELFGQNEKSELEEVLKQYIRNIRNIDILIKIQELTIKILRVSNYHYGSHIIDCIQDNLLLYKGVVGEKAYEIVENYEKAKHN